MVQINDNFTKFLTLVNTQLVARQQPLAEEKELNIVDKWFHVQALQKAAHMHAVTEILERRAKV